MLSWSCKVADKLFLVQQEVSSASTKVAAPKVCPVNYIVVLDCSGSMSYDLPKIREQLKRKLPKLLQPQDTISIIWFSGTRQFGTLLEAEPVATLTDLQAVNDAIDRWLRPVGMTGFKEPLEEASSLLARVAKKSAGVFSMIFLSDGCDNQCSRPEILKAVSNVAKGLSSATFVEYGNYADRPLLTAMAQLAGGSLIFAEDFDRYAPMFEASLAKKLSGAPRIEVALEGAPVEGFAFCADATDLICYEVSDGKVSVPKDTRGFYYLSRMPVGSVGDLASLGRSKDDTGGFVAMAYAAVSLFALRMKADLVLPLLKALGDIALINMFANCFGKQKYSEFTDRAKAAVFDPQKRLIEGWDPNKVPAEDAFTVLDLLNVLAADDDNRLLLDSPEFAYTRIGRGSVDPAGEDALVFEAAEEPNGYPVRNLTFNEDRPNVSVLIRKEGTVDLSKKLGKKEHLKVPRKFPTFVFRNYAIIKDGLVNVNRLPVHLTKGTIKRLVKDGMPLSVLRAFEGETTEQITKRLKKASDVVIDLRALPVINRKMVKSVSAKALFTSSYDLTCAQAAQKVYGSVKKDKFPRVSEGYKAIYGEEAAEWLKKQGLTDYSGFSPKQVQAASCDQYMGKELAVKIKGFSTLPSLADVKKRIASKKVTASAALMVPYVEEVDKFLASEAYKTAKDPDKVFGAWLDGQLEDARKTVRGLLFELAQAKFSISVGNTWPVEFKTLEENTLELEVGGEKLSCVLEAREITVNI
jgi:hypothetical protein